MSVLEPLFNIPVFSRIRRNHGLEHATLHVLAKQHRNTKMGGYSDFNGFWLVADLSTDEISAAAHEALQRMKAGEAGLAVHPNCGTNFATAGSLAGMVGVLGMLGVGERKRDKFERLPLVAVLATLALILAQPLGLLIQKNLTTSGNPGSLEIMTIQRVPRGRLPTHRIITQG